MARRCRHQELGLGRRGEYELAIAQAARADLLPDRWRRQLQPLPRERSPPRYWESA